MTRLQGLSLVSLVVGLVLAAFVVPWSLSSINQTTRMLQQVQEQTTPVPVPTPDAAAIAAAQVQAQAEAAAAKAAREQTARIQAEMAKLAIPAAKPEPKPEPPHPAYSFAAPGPTLIPLEGWVDQPNKDRSGRIHTNLMVRQLKLSAKPKVAARKPCLEMVRRPAQRFTAPGGYIDAPARTIPAACRE